MEFYLVFGALRRPVDFAGGKALDWGQPPIGIYQAETPEEACQAATEDAGPMSAYCAVQCTPYGLNQGTKAKQVGRQQGGSDRLADILERMEAANAELRELKEGSGD